MLRTVAAQCHLHGRRGCLAAVVLRPTIARASSGAAAATASAPSGASQPLRGAAVALVAVTALDLQRRRAVTGFSHHDAVCCAGSSGDGPSDGSLRVGLCACAGAGILAAAAALIFRCSAPTPASSQAERSLDTVVPLADEQLRLVLQQLRQSLDLYARESSVAEVDVIVAGTEEEQEEIGLARFYTQKAKASGSTGAGGVAVASLPAKDAALRAALESVLIACKDGCCRRPEFMALLSLASVMRPSSLRGNARPPHFNEAVVVVFSSLDADGDAKLSLQEWLGFYNVAQAFSLVPPAPLGHEQPARWHGEEALALFREMETANGELELSDFAAWCRRRLNRERLFSEYTREAVGTAGK